MPYASEKFTRSVILYMARTINVPDLRTSVERGSLASADLKSREDYFKFGAGIFMLIGFLAILFSMICVVLTLVFHGILSGWFFFYYAPGFVLHSIGVTLSMKERSSAKNLVSNFDRKSLTLSCVSGILIALFVTSFSVMNYMEYMEMKNS